MTPCPACNRHVRANPCPFCGAEVEVVARGEPSGRLSRAARLAFGAAVATSMLACGDKGSSGAKNPTADNDAGVVDQDMDPRHRRGGGDGNEAMPYGAPPVRQQRRVV